MVTVEVIVLCISGASIQVCVEFGFRISPCSGVTIIGIMRGESKGKGPGDPHRFKTPEVLGKEYVEVLVSKDKVPAVSLQEAKPRRSFGKGDAGRHGAIRLLTVCT
jgi:hypothetical protein